VIRAGLERKGRRDHDQVRFKVGETTEQFSEAKIETDRKADAHTYEDFEDASFNFSEAASRDGLQLGVGLEYPLGKGAYGKVEYLYNDYKDFDIDPPVLTGDFTRHQAAAGIGIKF